MSAQIIPMHLRVPERTCAFCQRTESQVAKLIAGMMGQCICDDCIKKAKALIDDQVAA